MDSVDGEVLPSSMVQLPSFREMPTPSFMWGELEGAAFAQRISSVYDVVVHWHRNLLLVPFGKVGKAFVKELTKLFTAYGEGGAMECVAMKAAMVMCSLVLQKPQCSAKSRDLIICLECRLDLWGQVMIGELTQEGKVIQPHLAASRAKTSKFQHSNVHRLFVNRMLHGDVKAAISLLDSDEHSGAPMSLDKPLYPVIPSWTVCDKLLKKHPNGQPAHCDALKTLEGYNDIFDALDGGFDSWRCSSYSSCSQSIWA